MLSTNIFNALPTTINAFPKTFPSVVANSLIAVLFLEKKNSKLPNCFVNTLKKPTETWLANANKMFCKAIIEPEIPAFKFWFALPNLPLPENSLSKNLRASLAPTSNPLGMPSNILIFSSANTLALSNPFVVALLNWSTVVSNPKPVCADILEIISKFFTRYLKRCICTYYM